MDDWGDKSGRLTATGARLAVFAIYASVSSIALLGRLVRGLLGVEGPFTGADRSRLLLTGTFYNPGWFRSHIMPLSACRTLREILVVCDEPLFDVPKVRYECPPAWLVKWAGRSLARLVWILRVGWRDRPAFYMGYHIMPNALICLVAGRLLGGEAIFQMTGGPIQVIGGGYGSENVLLRKLAKPSATLESLLFHILRQFDLIVVRGSRARDFVYRNRLGGRCLIVTGGINTQHFAPSGASKAYDMVCVSRLTPNKGLEFLLETAARLRQHRRDLRAAVVGGGPLADALQRQARSLALTDNVEFLGKRTDVADVLNTGRLFVLTSPSEGMSIAMLEAMACGLPVAVTDVGDLADAVRGCGTGVFLDGEDPDAAAAKLHELLSDEPALQEMSRAGRERIERHHSIEAIAGEWERNL